MTQRRRTKRSGFTLVEMLVVISIIVLAIALAIPLFSAISGDRSIDSAQNLVSAMLQRARARAIGLQERRGVFFFEDPKTRNVMMTVVKIYDSPAGTGWTTGYNYIDADTAMGEAQPLPKGVGAAFIIGKVTSGANTTYSKVGLVSFDALGRFEPITYGFEPNKNPEKGTGDSILKTQYFLDNSYRVWAGLNPPETAKSHVGIMLFDKKLFADADPSNPTPSSVAVSNTEAQWLDGQLAGKSGGLALMVNRYNGTLIRGE